MTDDEPLMWGEPINARCWHIFDGLRSLCGGWMMNPDQEVNLENDTYREGEDCKACCRKAGILDD